MKSLLLSVVLLCAVAQADVASVRRRVGRIDALKLSKHTFDRTDLSAEGAQISIWSLGKGAPRKIVANIYGETGQQHDTIYLEGGLPIFVLTVKERYDGIVSPQVKVASRTETRWYFEKGHLFQKRVGKKSVALTPAQKRAGENSVREMINTYTLVPSHRTAR